MLLFALLMGSLVFALPLTGEVWRRGRDNIVVRSRDEAIEYFEDKIEEASVYVNRRLRRVREQYEVASATLSVLGFLLKIIDKVLKFIARLLAG
jgi:hypothetical protein